MCRKCYLAISPHRVFSTVPLNYCGKYMWIHETVSSEIYCHSFWSPAEAGSHSSFHRRHRRLLLMGTWSALQKASTSRQHKAPPLSNVLHVQQPSIHCHTAQPPQPLSLFFLFLILQKKNQTLFLLSNRNVPFLGETHTQKWVKAITT